MAHLATSGPVLEVVTPNRSQPTDSTSVPQATAALAATPPTVPIRLSIDSVVFLITDLQELPPLDTEPVEQCKMRFRVMPGLLLQPPQHPATTPAAEGPTPNASPAPPSEPPQPPDPVQPIVYPILLERRALSAEVQLLSVAVERENPISGLSAFARVLNIPDYITHVPERIPVCLPYDLAAALRPAETTGLDLPDDALVRLDLQLPTGYALPELYRGKVVRLSVNFFTGSGGLALNGKPLYINSRSRPTYIRLASSGRRPLPDDFYRLRGLSGSLPATSDLPKSYADHTELVDPNAAIIARVGLTQS